MKRDVLVEAGHRCAIPTCRTVPVELAHIVPYSKTKVHEFGNLIALCPTCHTRFDTGDIDRQSMLQYKSNLSVLAGRYSEFERRVLELFSSDVEMNQQLVVTGGHEIHLLYLLRDGLIERTPGFKTMHSIVYGIKTPAHESYSPTQLGREFIKKWVNAQPVEPLDQD